MLVIRTYFALSPNAPVAQVENFGWVMRAHPSGLVSAFAQTNGRGRLHHDTAEQQIKIWILQILPG